jgi:hypothetical protein
MSGNAAKIKQVIKLRLNQDGIQSNAMEEMWDFHIQTACMEIAGTTYFRELLKTVQGSCSEKGVFTVNKSVVPYQYYYGGIVDEDYTWLRVTPVDYDYFTRYRSGYIRTVRISSGYMLQGRYTLLPTDDNNVTTLKFLELESAYSVKLIYYPITPDPDDFPEYFIPWIVSRVMELISVDVKSDSKDRYIQQLKEETMKVAKVVTNRANKIEKNLNKTIVSRKQRLWEQSGAYDLFYWKCV